MTKDTCEVFVHRTLRKHMKGVNILNDFKGSGYVDQLEAIVVEGSRQIVKGLLISFRGQGASANRLYNHRGIIV